MLKIQGSLLKTQLALYDWFYSRSRLLSTMFRFGTMIELPASMTHASIPVRERKKIGISDSLIKMSVRIEDVKDLINDIAQGLERM
jgi:cystathionine beta-lyase/cystathionine gamma-synthase